MNINRNEESPKVKRIHNPGREVLTGNVSAGAITLEMFQIASSYVYSKEDYKKAIKPYVERILRHIKEATKNAQIELGGKEHVSFGITRIRESAILCAAGYPDDHTAWDIFHMNIQMQAGEYEDIKNKLQHRLSHSTEADRDEALGYMATAGILITDVMFKNNKELEAEFARQLIVTMESLRAEVAMQSAREGMKDLFQALEFSKMLEERGIIYDENGDPKYSERYYELERLREEHKTSPTPPKSNTGGESPQEPLPGSEPGIQ